MQERVRLVNGRFNIKPDPTRGTTVQVVVPFKSDSRFARPDARPDRNRSTGTPPGHSGSVASGISN
jgi:hypothetical protein